MALSCRVTALAAQVLAAAAFMAGLSSFAGESSATVRIESFSYTGRDAAFEGTLAPGAYRNPVLAGFYPDPDVCRVGDDYYLVNSSFGYFPGIPIFHSRDLLNWTQIGNVVDRPAQLNYDGLGITRGIFAPGLSHHGDTFYLLCTFVDAGGNFVMTAKDPAGPWSDPVWLDYDGIDPSLFFDDDGRSWIVSNGAPPGNVSLYSGHRAIYIQEFDATSKRLLGKHAVIVNGGVDLSKHPVWIEGPHLFRKDGWYYLICAEGGTAEDHSEVVFRSRSPEGPFLPGPSNPILTQRTLPASRQNPVTCTGHAEFVRDRAGAWWAVFLGCRPYEADYYNTGRETFMLPVTWTDGWPSVLRAGEAVPYTVAGPKDAGPALEDTVPLTGNFTWSDDFTAERLAPLWLMLRRPQAPWFSVGAKSHLILTPGRAGLRGTGNPSFLGHRVQHARFEATVRLAAPSTPRVSAGLALFQNEEHHYVFGVATLSATHMKVFVEGVAGGGPAETSVTVPLHAGVLELKVACEDRALSFFYSTAPGAWERVGGSFDATQLSTKVAGGFVGAVVGPYALVTSP